MNILIVSYVDSITVSIKEVIKQSGKDANIDVVGGTLKATMMVQEYSNTMTKPILEPTMDFLKNLKLEAPNTKVFALFDEDETGEDGKDEVLELGYEIANFDFFSIEWENKLLEYL